MKPLFKQIPAAVAKKLNFAQALAYVGRIDNKGDLTFDLPIEDLGFISRKMITGNPLNAYASAIKVKRTTGGAELKYSESNGKWSKKEHIGRGINLSDKSFDEMKQYLTEINRERFFWSTPDKLSKFELASDIHAGVPSLLVQHVKQDMIKTTRNSIRVGMDKITETKSLPAFGLTVNPAKPGKIQEDAAQILFELTNAVTSFCHNAEVTEMDVTVTLSDFTWNKLAMAGLIGDRVTKTIVSGRFAMGTIAGFKVQSGSIFLPKLVNIDKGLTELKKVKDITGKDAEGTSLADKFAENQIVDATLVSGAGKAHKVLGFIGTNDSFVHNLDVTAMNTGNVDNTNDIEFYAEVRTMNVVPKRTVTNSLLAVLFEDSLANATDDAKEVKDDKADALIATAMNLTVDKLVAPSMAKTPKKGHIVDLNPIITGITGKLAADAVLGKKVAVNIIVNGKTIKTIKITAVA